MTSIDGVARAKVYYPILDVLRFLSALAVVLVHLGYMVWLVPDPARARVALLPAGPPPVPLFWWGGIGVQVFFVISGFVIAASANGASPFAFVRNRVERLYPGVWICAAISAAVLLTHAVYPIGTTLWLFVRSAILLPVGPWIDGQYWTLRAEIGFYLTILMLLLITGTRPFQHLACALVLLSTPSLVAQSLAGLGIITHNPFAFIANGVAQLLPIHFGTYFGLGMLLWLRHERLLHFWGLPFGALALVNGALAAASHAAGNARNFAGKVPIVAETWWIPLVVWFATCALIGLSRPLHLAPNRPMPRRVRLLRTLGLATYPLYLVHFMPGLWMVGALLRVGATPLLSLLSVVVLLVLLSIVIALAGEPPLRATLRHASSWLVKRGLIPTRALARTTPIGKRLATVSAPHAGTSAIA